MGCCVLLLEGGKFPLHFLQSSLCVRQRRICLDGPAKMRLAGLQIVLVGNQAQVVVGCRFTYSQNQMFFCSVHVP